MKKKEEIKKHKANLGIGVVGGFVAGGSLLSYQILLPYGLGYAIIGAILVAWIIYKMSVKMIERNVYR